MHDHQSYSFFKNQEYNYHLEPMCALDPLLLIPRLEYLPPIFDLVKKRNSNYSIVFLDLKNFHIVNDIYDYDTGDKVILKFIDIARSSIPKGSITLRFRHGDEFIFFIPKSLIKTNQIFVRIKNNCEKFNFFSNYKKDSIEISFRFAAVEVNRAKTFRELLQIGEEKLRDVKKVGSPRT
ncbi:diguanylate cyclase [Cyclobacterium salsum]|uniref:diguanylate cyclase n=1 Tax=Cyclobacterium salsum TaxID=2666329 RepID=UPI001390ADF9|nr:diguanylate cyclase [Cyclobacterium salsum]